MKLHYGIDRFLLKGGQVFSFGWVISPEISVRRIVLCLVQEDGVVQQFDAEQGQMREDVAGQFPQYPHALHGGFMVFGGWTGSPVRAAHYRIEFETGPDCQIELPQPDVPGSGSIPRIKTFRMLVSKANAAAQRLGWRSAGAKALAYLRRQPKPAHQGLAAVVADIGDGPVTWVLDHDMGGGANIYRDRWVDDCAKKGQVVALLGFHVATLSYFVQFSNVQDGSRYELESLDAALHIAKQLNITQLVYNCAVSFRLPLELVRWMLEVKQKSGAELLVLVHDFFIACPSHCLLDYTGKFCGIPDERQCQTCLGAHTGSFVSATGVRDMRQWRQIWRKVLTAADEVRLFSASSYELLARAYPDVQKQTWRVLPHVLPQPFPPIALQAGRCLNVGVVGTLGKHKGAQVVADLALEIQRQRSSARITVVGTLDAAVPADIVTITGWYRPEQLPALLVDNGVNVVLFPSIWPETFSYVAHELAAMRVPLAVFDFGAPADLVRTYPIGRLLPMSDAAELLTHLSVFRQEIYFVEDIPA